MKKYFNRIIWTILLSFAFANAQEVHVFESDPGALGSTNVDRVSNNELNQKILFIPVVSQDFVGYDPANNLFETLFPGVRADFIAKANTNNMVWQENSYGKISFQSDVLNRVYQMPRELEFYVNPDYVTPNLKGTIMDPLPITPSNNNFQLTLHINDSDETSFSISFDGMTAYANYSELVTEINSQISAAVGDKLSVSLSGSTLNFEVEQTYVTKGTYIRVDIASSDAGLLDELGLDRPELDLPARRITSTGTSYPITTLGVPVTITVEFENETDPPVNFDFNLPAATTYNTVNDFITAFEAVHSELTLTAEPGNNLEITLDPGILTDITQITLSGNSTILDEMGFDTSTEIVGTINQSARNTVKGNRSLLCGQALAAWLLDEVNRNNPGLSFSATDEGAIKTIADNLFDEYRSIAVMIMDVPAGKREGASGGYINLGVENGGYLFSHQTYASIQILYGYTSESTIAHEVGHNIGFWDLYNNGGGKYDTRLKYVNEWDIMDDQGNLPHTGAWHKQVVANWFDLDGSNYEIFEEPGDTGSEVERYVLTPIEMNKDYDNNLAGVPAGRTVTKAIQVVFGLTDPEPMHYLFLQNRQKGANYSQTLPRRVVGGDRGGMEITDCLSPRNYDFFRPESRNVVHIMTDEATFEGDAKPITPGISVDLLSTFPAYDGVEVNIVGEIPGPAPFADRPSYLVDVTREQKEKLDLTITPWGAPPYESVDIWIEHNDGSLATDALSGNGEATRWSPDYNPAANGGEHLNLIRVKVRNNGTIDATNVTVRVKVNQPGGMGDSGSWVTLGISDGQNIPKDGFAIFNLGWSPKVNAHTCIRAEIWRHDSPLSDVNPWNDSTQENVSLFNPTSSSPWRDEHFEFDLTNSRTTPLWVQVAPKNLPRGFSVNLDDEYFLIEGNTTKRISGVLSLDDAIIPTPDPNIFNLESYNQDPRRYRTKPQPFHLEAFVVGDEYRLPIGGITYVVYPSVNLEIDTETTVNTDGTVTVTGTTKPRAPNQDLEIIVKYPSGRMEWIEVTTDGLGNFKETITPKETGQIRICIDNPPGTGYAPTRTGETIVNTKHPTGAFHSEKWEVNFFLGGLYFTDLPSYGSNIQTGFRFSYDLTDIFDLEFEASTSKIKDNIDEGLLGGIQGQLLYEPFGGRKVYPFATLGTGYYWFSRINQWEDFYGIVYGVGLKFDAYKWLQFRIDARFNNYINTDTNFDNLQVNWGVRFPF